ncbi:MAG TPA: hypothetical protein VKE51_20925 [Vicinamibacterales bacterium]|nr:hypothetical protein [Vicinamibacterales bacterium]
MTLAFTRPGLWRLLEGKKMAPRCAGFGLFRKTGYKIFDRDHDFGVHNAAAGLRIGERLALRRSVVNLGDGRLAVRESVFNEKFQPPKTLKAVRTIRLGHHAVAINDPL